MALAGALAAPAQVANRLRETVLCLVSVVVAGSAFGLLVPPALAAVTSSGAATPTSVALVGDVSTVGLPAAPAISRLQVRNDGAGAVRWSLRTTVLGAGAPGVSISAWVPTGDGCSEPPTATLDEGWSPDALPAGAAVPVCVRVSTHGSATGAAQPRVTVHARATP